jgi:hypothetical protein
MNTQININKEIDPDFVEQKLTDEEYEELGRCFFADLDVYFREVDAWLDIYNGKVMCYILEFKQDKALKKIWESMAFLTRNDYMSLKKMRKLPDLNNCEIITCKELIELGLRGKKK